MASQFVYLDIFNKDYIYNYGICLKFFIMQSVKLEVSQL
jgi:hypothetical protein